MRYRTLGKTGLELSVLGFGAMRFPMRGDVVDRDLSIPMIHRAFEGGVNYIDSAVFYCNHDSQRVVGEALRSWKGHHVYVGTKNDYYGVDEGTWRKNLENSLEHLRINTIDLYHTHGVTWNAYIEAVEPSISKWLSKAKDEGLIGHICTSFHDTPTALTKIIDTGFYDSILLQYNLLDRQLESGIQYAHEKGIGVVVMGPVAGGQLKDPAEALQFVFSNPYVTTALSGMSTMEQVEQNLATASNSATPVNPASAQSAEIYCPTCNYCKPCPRDVDIPQIFGIYNRWRVDGRPETKIRYSNARSDCIGCGDCEPRCPQKHPIRKYLQDIRTALGK